MQHSILNLKYPVIGLAPMDGVSDTIFRQVTKKYGSPDIMFTEFTNVMGLCIAGDNLLKAFHYEEMERPIIGQIYGKEPEYFYHAAKIICALGFDGVDINMGCPAKTVTAHGAGAGLIRTPDLAREIVAAVKEGVQHWVDNGELTGLSERTRKAVDELVTNYKLRITREADRLLIPVSVKTRIGYDIPVTENWIKNLTEARPDWLSVHGRTLKQMYTGNANWDELKVAVNSTDLPMFANGDVKTHDDIQKILDYTGAAGTLIGRGTFGDPWVFTGQVPTMAEVLNVLLEHTELFVKENPEPRAFFQMRKHFGWYIKGFDGAKEMREKLMKTTSLEEVKGVLASVNVN